MQAYDIVMLIVLAAATLFGMIKGFAWQVASLASIVVSYFVALNFREKVAAKIQVGPPMNTFIAMLLIYAVTSFAIWVVFRLISSSIDRVRLRDFDRQMGTAFGLGKGVIYCLLITMFAMTLLGQNQQRAIVESKSGHYISSILAAAEGVVLPHEIETIIRPHLDRVRQQLDGKAVATTTAGGSPWSSELAEQVGSLAGGILNGQNPQVQTQAPPGYPTSQTTISDALGNVIDAARQNPNWPQGTNNYQNNQNQASAGQGGWNGSATAPLPNTGFYSGIQPSQSPALLPNTNTGNYPQQSPSQQQYNSVLPYR